jgi:translation initiation factor 2B subunit (eIF-2B alpha/beta/delta family)
MSRDAVVCLCRCGTEVLLCRRDGEERWDGVSIDIGEDTDPAAAAKRAIDEILAESTTWTLVRGGESIAPADRPGRRHPFCFECKSRELRPDADASREIEWQQPPAVLERTTVPGLWEAYRAVGPSLASVRDDDIHGAADISLRALEVIRDRAAELAAADPDRDRSAVEPLARDLLGSRPSMAVVHNRLNRVIATGGETVASIRDQAIEACAAAVGADEAAAERAAAAIGDRVLTLSRSGTVFKALQAGAPPVVFVAESRPGREGIAVAESFAAAGGDAAVVADAAVGSLIADGSVDTVLVGADSVLADGSVVNKVGTRHAALAASDAGVACLVVCSRDKITFGTEIDLEHGDPEAVHAGEADVSVHNPTFERVPASLFDGVITESGACSPTEIQSIAAEHASLAEWDE